jgi:DNA replicative helicase MCM subunit Mcm2 (Cdc46/Mcm family)
MNKDNPDRTAIRAMEQKMTAMARSYLKDGGDESDRVSDRLSARLRGLEQRDDMDKLDRAERGEMVHLRGIMSRIGDVRNRVEAGGITADAGQDRVKALAAESAAPWAAGYRRLLGRHAELDKEKRQADLRGARPSPSVMQQLGSIQSRLNEVDKLRKLLNDNKMTPAMFNSAVAYITKE